MRSFLDDYIDRVITATAIRLKEDLVTEDTEILSIKDLLKGKGIEVMSFGDLIGESTGLHDR